MDDIRRELIEIKNRLLESEYRLEVLEAIVSMNVDGGEFPEDEEPQHIQEEVEEFEDMPRGHARIHYIPAVSAVHDYGGSISADEVHFGPIPHGQHGVARDVPEPNVDEMHVDNPTEGLPRDNPTEGSNSAPMPGSGLQQQQGQQHGEGAADMNGRALLMSAFIPVMVPIYQPHLSSMSHCLPQLMMPQMFPMGGNWYYGMPNYSDMHGVGMQPSGTMPMGMSSFRVVHRQNKNHQEPNSMPCTCNAAVQAEMHGELQQRGDEVVYENEVVNGNEELAMEAEVVTPNQRFNVDIIPPPPQFRDSENFGSQPKSKKLKVSNAETTQEKEQGQSQEVEMEKVDDQEQTENVEPTAQEQESTTEELPPEGNGKAKNATEKME